ncbi:MAG: NUDIX hydrolase [Dehalococcoidales bacterium]
MTEGGLISSRVVYEGHAVKLRVNEIVTTDGAKKRREIVEHYDCVAIVAVDREDVLMVRQFREPVERELLEIPAGGIEPGESPEFTVDREMREETGYRPQKLTRLGGFYSVPGYGTEYLYLFLATDLTPAPLVAEDTASISVVRLPVKRILQSIASGEICDAKSIAGLLIFLDYDQAQ